MDNGWNFSLVNKTDKQSFNSLNISGMNHQTGNTSGCSHRKISVVLKQAGGRCETLSYILGNTFQLCHSHYHFHLRFVYSERKNRKQRENIQRSAEIGCQRSEYGMLLEPQTVLLPEYLAKHQSARIALFTPVVNYANSLLNHLENAH